MCLFVCTLCVSVCVCVFVCVYRGRGKRERATVCVCVCVCVRFFMRVFMRGLMCPDIHTGLVPCTRACRVPSCTCLLIFTVKYFARCFSLHFLPSLSCSLCAHPNTHVQEFTVMTYVQIQAHGRTRTRKHIHENTYTQTCTHTRAGMYYQTDRQTHAGTQLTCPPHPMSLPMPLTHLTPHAPHAPHPPIPPMPQPLHVE